MHRILKWREKENMDGIACKRKSLDQEIKVGKNVLRKG
jgi:hypothetical protein